MLEQQRREQAQSPEPYQDNSTHLNIDMDTTGDRNGGEVPATVEINFGLEPAAYRYESWSEMADGWTESVLQ